mmetsp:Transcript_25705/g.59959  ORF Transcript_25705/g.59959 Transcript_25705/m.59959 type:complete len:100 (+) Transcript_25705:182-481(+)
MISISSLTASDLFALVRRMLLASVVLALPSLWFCPAAAAPVEGVVAAESSVMLGVLGHSMASTVFSEMAESLIMMVMGAMTVLLMRGLGRSQLALVAGA